MILLIHRQADSKQRNELYNQLADKGLQPTNISERNAEGTSERILFPGAILNYLSKEQPLLLTIFQKSNPCYF